MKMNRRTAAVLILAVLTGAAGTTIGVLRAQQPNVTTAPVPPQSLRAPAPPGAHAYDPYAPTAPAAGAPSLPLEFTPRVGAAGGVPHPAYDLMMGFGQAGDNSLQRTNAELARQTESLATKYVDASQDEERNKIKAELSELLTKQFSIQQQLREEEVAHIEARVKKLRELIEKRKAAQQSIIASRLEQLLREAEGLGWTAGAAEPPRVFRGAAGNRFSAPAPVPNPVIREK